MLIEMHVCMYAQRVCNHECETIVLFVSGSPRYRLSDYDHHLQMGNDGNSKTNKQM